MRWLVPELVYNGAALVRAAVAIEGGQVVRVEPVDCPDIRGEVERMPRKALFPGFVNAHSHAFQRGLRGHVQFAETGADSFWTWRERMYGLASTLSPEGVEAVSALAFLEMVLAGFTTVGEFHYVHHQPDGTPYADPDELALRVVAAAQAVGIEIVVLRVAYARAGFNVDAAPRQRRFIDHDPDDVLAAVSRLAARGIRTGLAPHSMRAVPYAWLQRFRDFDGVIHAHVGEQPAEVQAAMQEYGRRPLHVFGDAGLVDQRFTAVHLTHPDASEVDRIERSGGRVCVCPSTESDLGDGFFPAEALGGTPVCLGSDSHALIDPFAEMRAIEWNARSLAGRRNVLPHVGMDGLATRLLDTATVQGARALGLATTGEIAVGAQADFIGLDLDHVSLAGARTLPALVFGGGPALVRDVWVGGRRVVRDGHHPAACGIIEAAVRVLEATC